jgi:AcrR family transcriptional regulator
MWYVSTGRFLSATPVRVSHASIADKSHRFGPAGPILHACDRSDVAQTLVSAASRLVSTLGVLPIRFPGELVRIRASAQTESAVAQWTSRSGGLGEPITDCGTILNYSQYMASQAERRRETRRRILTASRKLFKAHGFDGTSVDQIVASANLAKGTFYQHFHTKIDVALAITSKETEHFIERTRTELASGQSPLAVGRELLQSMATWFEKNRGLARPLILHALDQPRIETPGSTQALLALIFTAAQTKREVRADLPADYMSGLLAGSIALMLLHWTLHGKRGQLQEWFGIACRLHLEGALPR